VILQAVLVETDVNGNKNVMRKLLLGPGGQEISTPLVAGTPMDVVVPVNYPVDVNIADGDNLYVVAFVQHIVQNPVSKKILQSVIAKAPYKVRQAPVGLPDDPVIQEVYSIDVYPNPASQQLRFRLGSPLSRTYYWKVIDQRGVTVRAGDMHRDLTNPQEVDISELANGIYFLAIHGSDNKTIRYEKIAVINRP
jgi:hypothetical protein